MTKANSLSSQLLYMRTCQSNEEHKYIRNLNWWPGREGHVDYLHTAALGLNSFYLGMTRLGTHKLGIQEKSSLCTLRDKRARNHSGQYGY